MKTLKLLAGAAAAATIAGAASAATVFGVSDLPAGPTPNATEEANILAGAAALGVPATAANIEGFLIPFTGTLTTNFSFTGVVAGQTFLQFVFEDLDLNPINDPGSFFEKIIVSNSTGLGPIEIDTVGDAGSFVVPGTEGADAAVALQFDLGVLGGGNYTATLVSSSTGGSGSGNTAEFVIASMSSTPFNVIPLPAAGWMLLAGVGGIAAVSRRKKKAA